MIGGGHPKSEVGRVDESSLFTRAAGVLGLEHELEGRSL
jgi:hypothetical protein